MSQLQLWPGVPELTIKTAKNHHNYRARDIGAQSASFNKGRSSMVNRFFLWQSRIFNSGYHVCWTFVALTLGVVFCSPSLGQSSNRQTVINDLGKESSERIRKDNSVAEEGVFDPRRAFAHLQNICDLGPRYSGSDGMKKQQEYLQKHFSQLNAGVHFQPFTLAHPRFGTEVTLRNLLIRWHPERIERLMVCCHYDTRPFPDRDAVNPRGTFIGANDGGSGVALLCELGNHIDAIEGKLGIDFVFFDAEEFVFARQDPLFIGSTHFANEYAAGRVQANYRCGVLVDMVADANLEIYYEGNSLSKAPRVTRHLWEIAGKLGIKEFVAKKRHVIRDDHLPLNQIARIPVCDIIDFDYPVKGNSYWHTQKDTIEHCSAESLGKVGKVVLQWLKEMQTK